MGKPSKKRGKARGLKLGKNPTSTTRPGWDTLACVTNLVAGIDGETMRGPSVNSAGWDSPSPWRDSESPRAAAFVCPNAAKRGETDDKAAGSDMLLSSCRIPSADHFSSLVILLTRRSQTFLSSSVLFVSDDAA